MGNDTTLKTVEEQAIEVAEAAPRELRRERRMARRRAPRRHSKGKEAQ